jgi:hypothetical protein
MYLRETCWEGVDWIHLVQDRGQAEQLLAYQVGLYGVS